MSDTHSTLVWEAPDGEEYFPDAVAAPTDQPGVVEATSWHRHDLDDIAAQLVARLNRTMAATPLRPPGGLRLVR